MMNRLALVLLLAGAALAGSARPALAQQTLNLSLGHFMMPAAGRVETDILLIENADLAFDVNDFNGTTIGGEWLVPISDRYEIGGGVSFSRKSVRASHERVANSDGSSISREMRLRQMPFAVTVRMLPLGQSYSVQPYVGGGVAVINWRFTESGDFAWPNIPVFRGEQFTAIGNAIGPLALVGLRVAGDRFAYGVEGRLQSARGSFGDTFGHVWNPDIDLGGWTVQFTTGMRFGE